MRPEVDRMLTDHVQRTPGMTLSATVNAALVEYLEAAALAAYREWDRAAGHEESQALAAFAAYEDRMWATA